MIYFYKVYINTLDICFRWLLSHVRYGNLLKISALILRVHFSLDVSDIFGGVSEVVRIFSEFLPSKMASLFSPISSGISALAARSSSVLISGGFRASQCSPCFSGDLQSSWKDCFALVSVSPEVFSHRSLHIVSCRRRSQWASYLL